MSCIQALLNTLLHSEPWVCDIRLLPSLNNSDIYDTTRLSILIMIVGAKYLEQCSARIVCQTWETRVDRSAEHCQDCDSQDYDSWLSDSALRRIIYVYHQKSGIFRVTDFTRFPTTSSDGGDIHWNVINDRTFIRWNSETRANDRRWSS